MSIARPKMHAIDIFLQIIERKDGQEWGHIPLTRIHLSIELPFL
jgi:hypothetical protein